MKHKPIKEVTFTIVENKIYPSHQLLLSYFIADRVVVNKTIEIRALTIEQLLYALLRNYSRIVYWAILHMLYKLGFIDIKPWESFSWRKHFRWLPDRKKRVNRD